MLKRSSLRLFSIATICEHLGSRKKLTKEALGPPREVSETTDAMLMRHCASHTSSGRLPLTKSQTDGVQGSDVAPQVEGRKIDEATAGVVRTRPKSSSVRSE